MKRIHENRGFTLVEIAVGIVLLGLVLLAFAGMSSVVQRSAGHTRQYADAQQTRARAGLLTASSRGGLRRGGLRRQEPSCTQARPVAFNADIDGGR
jgi:prepilin-type N-terminal cleavage/methylation domain-containing protein